MTHTSESIKGLDFNFHSNTTEIEPLINKHDTKLLSSSYKLNMTVQLPIYNGYGITSLAFGRGDGSIVIANNPLAAAATAPTKNAGKLPPPNSASHGPLKNDTNIYIYIYFTFRT